MGCMDQVGESAWDHTERCVGRRPYRTRISARRGSYLCDWCMKWHHHKVDDRFRGVKEYPRRRPVRASIENHGQEPTTA